ncbi:MAG: helix-turn-helix domain-containing protein [Bacteroides sp.]|nr:helix-turn-helix domain-containing protein [Bacteroides sp.]
MSLPIQKAVRSSRDRQQNDLYATSPEAVEALLEKEKFHNNILEPCCGLGHIAMVLESHNYHVISSDKNFYGYGQEGIDFLNNDDFFTGLDVDVITNPPYHLAIPMLERALEIAKFKVAMLFPFWYLIKFYYNPPARVYLFTRKIDIAKDGDFETFKNKNMKDYAWFVFEKGCKAATTVHYIINNKKVTPTIKKLEEKYAKDEVFWNSSKDSMKRHAFLLHNEGISNRAIARKLGVTEGTIRYWFKCVNYAPSPGVCSKNKSVSE